MSYNKMMEIKAAETNVPYQNVWIKLILVLERHSEAKNFIKCKNKIQ